MIVEITVDFLSPSWWEVKVSVTVALFVIIASWLFTYGGEGGGGDGGRDSNRSSSAGDDINGNKYKKPLYRVYKDTNNGNTIN
ncbi:hypothetical protein LguiA_005655 [Lonicera macranthoides]